MSYPFNEDRPEFPVVRSGEGRLIERDDVRALLVADRTAFAWARRVLFSTKLTVTFIGEQIRIPVQLSPLPFGWGRQIVVAWYGERSAGIDPITVTVGSAQLSVDVSSNKEYLVDSAEIEDAGDVVELVIEDEGELATGTIVVHEGIAVPTTPIPQSVIDQYWPDEGVGYEEEE